MAPEPSVNFDVHMNESKNLQNQFEESESHKSIVNVELPSEHVRRKSKLDMFLEKRTYTNTT